ncbi:MAG: iron complex outermembrane receptor protein [Psychroserpens sp.]|jgi:iron complex outermembrane receptor protein
MKKIIFKTVLLVSICCFSITNAQTTLSGKVTDGSNAILGANVILLETGKGASTNENGEYIIKNISGNTYFIEISYLGYKSITKSITLEKNQKHVIDFMLQKTTGELDEVIISANRRLQNIQKTAVSVSAISAKEVAQLQIKEFNELSSIAPNFNTFDDGGTGIFTLISTRGISTIDVNPTVGVYVDDVPYFTSLAFPLSLSDVDKIEILRGPQGTLYGRNALAGVIKITSKRPQNKLTGFATLSYGNLNAKEIGFGFGAPLVKDKLFFRASGTINERDGFVKNEFNNTDLQNRKSIDANFRFKYFANDRLTLGLLYNVQRRESNAYAFVTSTPDNTFQDILENTPYQVNFDTDVLQTAVTQNLAFNLKYDFNTFSLDAITAYQVTDQYSLDELDFSPLNIQSASKDSDYINFSQEIRLASNGDTKLNWTTGVFAYLNNESRIDTNINGSDIGLVIPDFESIAPFSQIDTPDLERKGVALFGQATYDITDKLTFTGGLRFDYEEVDASVARTHTTPAFTASSFSESANFNAISPKIAISYQANDKVFVFANAAKGFRPGGINTFVINGADAPFDPETTFNYEAGIKTNLFENRLQLNLTGFYISYENQQAFTVLDLTNFIIGVDNIGESRSYGLELESKWAATKGLTFNMNFGYLNTEILTYAPIDFQTGEENDLSGRNLPLSPEFNGNLNINYIKPLNKKLNLEASVDYNYKSEFSFNFANDATQDAYGLLNSRIGITSKHVDFFLWGKNIADVTYFSYGYGVGTFNAASFGLPQTYGVTLTAKL